MKYFCKFCGTQIPWRKGNKVFCNSLCCGQYNFTKAHERFLNGLIHRRTTLRIHLEKERGHRCEVCGNSEWLGKPIPLIVDHINGNWRNDFPSNLRLVCGNCDMFLPTYKSKNKGMGRPSRRVPKSPKGMAPHL